MDVAMLTNEEFDKIKKTIKAIPVITKTLHRCFRKNKNFETNEYLLLKACKTLKYADRDRDLSILPIRTRQHFEHVLEVSKTSITVLINWKSNNKKKLKLSQQILTRVIENLKVENCSENSNSEEDDDY